MPTLWSPEVEKGHSGTSKSYRIQLCDYDHDYDYDYILQLFKDKKLCIQN